MERITRKRYSRQFKQDAVKLVTESGYKVSEAARSLDVDAKMLSKWKREFEAEAVGSRLEPNERDELIRLRRENKRLRQEREILKKAAAFFARESG